ncbi:MAG: hypothetical protein KZQ74_05645 [gamma proteobacterium symbiont of Bathyaustriella thionipta]|nr:hypothetical protein [gamma proteobacterium symbiont of Bathyaustriella thionipta]MCU7966669.1 hypothetical protein [gamma proteobacterium symbiont of Bathyaustriella thionipta]
MQWDFTNEEVVRGEVRYSLIEFRRDLLEEVRSNIMSDDKAFILHHFNVIYELCHWLATGREFDDFVLTMPDSNTFNAITLTTLKEHMEDNIAMLGAILQRMIMDGVEQGSPLEQVIDRVAKQHEIILEKEI